MNPEVSIIVPTYNSEEYIAQALESVFNQTHWNLEVILIDDSSTDSTLSIARSFNEKRLRIFTNSRNRGVSYSRNRGIRHAKGKWIALLDSDDWYAPERIEQLLLAARETSADLIADDLFLIQDSQACHWSTLLQENRLESLSSWQLIDAVKFVKSDRPSAIGAKRNWSLGYIKPLIKKEFLSQNNIRYRENINVGEDFTLYLECLWHHARFYMVNRPYYYYRTRQLSLSTRKPIDYLLQSEQITQSFIVRLTHSDLDVNIHKALQQNLVVFRKRLTYYHLKETLQQKKFLKAIRLIVTAPYLLLDIFRKFYNTLFNKPGTIIEPQPKNRSGINAMRLKNKSRVKTKSYWKKIYNASQPKDIKLSDRF